MGTSSRFLLAAVLIAIAASFMFPFAHAQKTREALSEAEVIRLLQGDVAPQRVGKLAREFGITFDVNRAVERNLRSAGADDQLLQTLRELGPGKGQAKAKSESAKTGAGAPTGILLIIVDAACKLSVDGEDLGELAAGASKRVTLPFGEHLVRAVSNEEPNTAVQWTGKVERPEQSLVQLHLADQVAITKRALEMQAAHAALMERAKPFSDILGKWKSAPQTDHWEGCNFTYEFSSEFRPEHIHNDRIDEEIIHFGRLSPDTTECRAQAGAYEVGERKYRFVWSHDRVNGGYVRSNTHDGLEFKHFIRFTSPTSFEKFTTVDGKPLMKPGVRGGPGRRIIHYFTKVGP